MLRSKGDLYCAAKPPDLARAEDAFTTSLDVARQHGAKLSELRATATLARFRQRNGSTDTLRRELRELCDWFPQDCDVPDLVEARTLLHALER